MITGTELTIYQDGIHWYVNIKMYMGGVCFFDIDQAFASQLLAIQFCGKWVSATRPAPEVIL